MHRYLLALFVCIPVWAVHTVAQVGQMYVTNYDVDAGLKVLNWLQGAEFDSNVAREHLFHLYQVDQYARHSQGEISAEQKQQVFEHFAKSKNKTSDEMLQYIKQEGFDIEKVHFVLETSAYERDLVVQLYRDEVTPSSRDLADYRSEKQKLQLIDAQAIIAQDNKKLFITQWPKTTSDELKKVTFTQTQLQHLPDVYQKTAQGMSMGEISKPFYAHGNYHVLYVTHKSSLPTDEALKQMYMNEHLHGKMPAWHALLATDMPVKTF